jgi:adenylate kinase family enzyme
MPTATFHAEVARIAQLPRWVIEGNYTDTIEPRFSAADTVIYLDAPTLLCMARLLRRTIANYGRVRTDAAPGCPERFDSEFMRFAWSWNRTRRAKSMVPVDRFCGSKIVIRSKYESRRLLAT